MSVVRCYEWGFFGREIWRDGDVQGLVGWLGLCWANLLELCCTAYMLVLEDLLFG